MKRMRIVTAGLILTLMLSVTGLVSAATWTVGTTGVPGWGQWGVTQKLNLKTTNSQYASFNGDAMPNSFGYKAKLVNNVGTTRSAETGLYKNKTTRASNNTGVKNKHYRAAVRSSNFEPNYSNVRLHFSADKK